MPNSKDNNGNTLLHIAAQNNKTDECLRLIQQGAKVNETNHNHDTALHLAAREKNRDIIKILLKSNANPAIKNRQQETALTIIAQSNNSDLYQLFLAKLQKANARFFDLEKGRQFVESFNTSSETSQPKPTSIKISASSSRAAIITYHLINDRLKNDLVLSSSPDLITAESGPAPKRFKTQHSRYSQNRSLTFTLATDGEREDAIKVIPLPTKNQAGNILLAQTPTYGSEEIKKIISPFWFTHKQLIHGIKNCLKTGIFFTRTSVETIIGQVANSYDVGALNRLVYLMGYAEIYRRIIPDKIHTLLQPDSDSDSDSDLVCLYPALPMGVALAMGLELISAGKITLQKYLSKDEDNLNPATGRILNVTTNGVRTKVSESLSSPEGYKLAQKKILLTLNLWMLKNPELTFSTELFHQLLRNTFGNHVKTPEGEEESISDNETYPSDDEESVSERLSI